MKRLIILEGMDRCGKTTAVDRIEKILTARGYRVHNMSYGKPLYPDYDYSYSYYLQEFYLYHHLLKSDSNNVVICDRSFLGEFVWSIYRSYNGEKMTQSLINRKIFQEISKELNLFILIDQYNDYIKRDDGESMFDDLKSFNQCKQKFIQAGQYLQRKVADYNIQVPLHIINLNEYRTNNIPQDIENIQSHILNLAT